jgi:hypothetical protein
MKTTFVVDRLKKKSANKSVACIAVRMNVGGQVPDYQTLNANLRVDR